jgi:hypothetical protein
MVITNTYLIVVITQQPCGTGRASQSSNSPDAAAVTASHAVVLASIPGMIQMFNCSLGPELAAELQSLVSGSDTSGLNPKSLHSGYDMKECVLLIVIHSSDGDFKPGGLP